MKAAAAQLDVSLTTMIPLSEATRERLTALFDSNDLATAEQLLVALTGEPSASPATPESLERLRFAAIRVSGGTVHGLREALDLATTDWRDLLAAARFAGDVRAHSQWKPLRCDLDAVLAWARGEAPSTVRFRKGARVTIAQGPLGQQRGTVMALTALEPTTRYQVVADSGEVAEVAQWWLGPAG